MDGGNIHIAVCRQEFFTKISIEDAGKGIVPEWQRMNPNMRRSSGAQNIRIKRAAWRNGWTAGSGGAQSLFPGGISAREGAEEYHQPYHRVKQRGDDPPVCRLP